MALSSPSLQPTMNFFFCAYFLQYFTSDFIASWDLQDLSWIWNLFEDKREKCWPTMNHDEMETAMTLEGSRHGNFKVIPSKTMGTCSTVCPQVSWSFHHDSWYVMICHDVSSNVIKGFKIARSIALVWTILKFLRVQVVQAIAHSFLFSYILKHFCLCICKKVPLLMSTIVY